MIHNPGAALPSQEQCWPFRLARALSSVAPRGKGAIPRLVGRLARPWFRHAFVTRHGAMVPLLPEALDVFVAMSRQRDSYDYWVFRAANAMLEPGGVFFDVGANVGYLSVEVANLRRPDGVWVYAFEPLPEMAENLRRAARLNSFDRLEVVEAAVGNRGGRVEFARRANSFVGSVAREDESGSYRVASVALDDVVCGEGFLPPDVLKIDVEGYEYPVLAGARRVLSEHQPAVIFEISPGTLGYGFRPAMLVDLLLEAGEYHFYTVKCAPLTREDIEAMAGKQGDILAIPPGRQERFEWFAAELRTGRIDSLWQQGPGPG